MISIRLHYDSIWLACARMKVAFLIYKACVGHSDKLLFRLSSENATDI